MRGRTYWLVATRESIHATWGIQFGSYDMLEAQQKRREIAGEESMQGNVYMFPCDERRPRDITRELRALNRVGTFMSDELKAEVTRIMDAGADYRQFWDDIYAAHLGRLSGRYVTQDNLHLFRRYRNSVSADPSRLLSDAGYEEEA